MSNIDKRTLREAAERATESDWIVDAHEGWHAVIPVADAVNGNYIIAEFQGPESKRNRDFVAAANPATVLALLDELKAAEKRCAALAAELHAVEAIHNEAVFITDDRYEQCPPEVQEIIKSLAVMQIPAYQSFLAEVRAQGVDVARNAMIDFVEGEVGPNENVPGLIRSAEICVSIAANLRKGVI